MAKRFVTTKVEVEGREETKVVELPTRDPEPWGNDASLHVVGRREKRMDALEKVTGEAEYTADVQLPGMLYVALKRANVAAGRITSRAILSFTPSRSVSKSASTQTRSRIAFA